VEEAHHRVGDKKVEEKSASTIDIYGRGSSSRGHYQYRSRVSKQEKPRMSRLPVTSEEISWRLPLDFQCQGPGYEYEDEYGPDYKYYVLMYHVHSQGPRALRFRAISRAQGL
jgi:hypothetical protein